MRALTSFYLSLAPALSFQVTDIHTLVDRVFAYLQSPSPVVALQPERTSFTVQEEVPVDSTRATAPFVDYGMPMTTTAQDNIAASMFMQPSTVRPTTVTFGDFHDAGNATNVLPAAPTAPTTTAYDLTNRANLHYDPAIIATGSAVLGGSGTDAASIAATAGTSDFGGVSSLDSEDLSVVEESVPAPSAVEPKRQQQSRPPRQHSPRRQSRQYSTGDGAPRGASRGGRGRGGSRGGRGGAARGISGGEARKE